MKEIIGIGNALVDVLYRIDNEAVIDEFGLRRGGMHLIDEKTFQGVCERMRGAACVCTTGGSASNTVLALAHLGMPVGLVGKICDDENGRFLKERLERAGVRTFFLHDEQPTGTASTFITPDGQRTFATYLGAAALLEKDEIKPSWFDGYSYLYIEGYLVQSHELMESVVDEARSRGVKVCVDLASYNIVEANLDFFGRLLQKTDIVFANEDEARAFTGLEAERALERLAQLCPVAVVKVGARGAYARSGRETAYVPAQAHIRVVDTTAAGDFFAAGFLYGLTRNRSLGQCLTAGTALASEIIQVVGTRLPEERWNKIKEIIK